MLMRNPTQSIMAAVWRLTGCVLFYNIILEDEIYTFAVQKCAEIKAKTAKRCAQTPIKLPRTDPKRIFTNFMPFTWRILMLTYWSVCQSVFRGVWVWSRRFEVSDDLSQVLYKVTTPSKRSGLHKRTFYDSASQTCSARSSKLHASGEADCGWKFQRKTRIRERMEREAEWEGGGHERQSKPSKDIWYFSSKHNTDLSHFAFPAQC